MSLINLLITQEMWQQVALARSWWRPLIFMNMLDSYLSCWGWNPHDTMCWFLMVVTLWPYNVYNSSACSSSHLADWCACVCWRGWGGGNGVLVKTDLCLCLCVPMCRLHIDLRRGRVCAWRNIRPLQMCAARTSAVFSAIVRKAVKMEGSATQQKPLVRKHR